MANLEQVKALLGALGVDLTDLAKLANAESTESTKAKGFDWRSEILGDGEGQVFKSINAQAVTTRGKEIPNFDAIGTALEYGETSVQDVVRIQPYQSADRKGRDEIIPAGLRKGGFRIDIEAAKALRDQLDDAIKAHEERKAKESKTTDSQQADVAKALQTLGAGNLDLNTLVNLLNNTQQSTQGNSETCDKHPNCDKPKGHVGRCRTKTKATK